MDALDLATAPGHLRDCRLMRAGGHAVYRGMVDAVLHARLVAEALEAWRAAEDATAREDRADEQRGGMPARAYRTAHGGPAQDAFYQAPWLAALLGDLSGLAVTPTGMRGTYNYYARPGDHLALHRDVRRCDLTLIVGLTAHDPLASGGGMLRLYPGRCGEPLSEIRRSPWQGARDVALAEGDALLLLGGIVPHCLRPVGPSQSRVVSIMCFRDLALANG